MDAPRLTRRSFGQKVISYLADNKDAKDVTFVVGSTGKEILALKVALQAACPALDKLFKHNWYKYWEKGNLRVPLPDVEPEAFRIFLEDDLEAAEIQRFRLSLETILHLIEISKKLEMAEMQEMFSAHMKIKGHIDDFGTPGASQLKSFDLKLRHKNQKHDSKNSCASEQYISTTGVHTAGNMSIAANCITYIGTSAHVPIFVPPVTHFYEIDPPTPSFTGRTDLLATIHSRMQVCSRKVRWDERTVVLCGLGGIGKTEIARMYAREFKSEAFIKNVAWIDAENRDCLKRSFDSLAAVLNVSTNESVNLNATVDRVYKHFSQHIGNGLIIFDNAPQFNDGEFQILNYLPTSESQERRPLILITSRDQIYEIPQENKILVHELTNDESIALFTTKLKLRLDQQSPNNRNAILKLAESFQGFPLGLSLAASNIDYLDESDLENEIEEYLKRMEMPQGGWGEDTQSGAATKYNLVMKNVWEITIKRIAADKCDGADAITLLNLMAFLPAENMTVESISDLFHYTCNKVITSRPFAILKKKSMISIDTSAESSATVMNIKAKRIRKIIRIHKLVQQCTRDNLNEDDACFFLTKICNYVSNRKLGNHTSHTTSGLLCAHNHLKIRNWPQDSIRYSVIFCSLLIFHEKRNSDILFELVRDVYAHLNIKTKELRDMQTEDKAINLFCLCLIWINKHNDVYSGYDTLLHNQTLRKDNFENAVSSFELERYDIDLGNPKTENMELPVLQKYVFNNCYHTLYTLKSEEKIQRIKNATSKAVLKYRSILESVMDDDNFKSDDILEQTSKIAEKDAIDKFNSLCKPTKNNELTDRRAELIQEFQIIYREFQNITKNRKEKAKQLLRTEAKHLCKSFADKIIAQTEYPLIAEDEFKTLHAEITIRLTEEFTQTFLDSPLFEFALKHLTQQLDTGRLSVYQAMKLEYTKVVDYANAVSAYALDCYKHRIQESMCCNFSELNIVHNNAKTAAIEILKTSNVIPRKILFERLTSLDYEIDSIYIQVICSLDKQTSRRRINSTVLENISSSTCLSSLAIGIDFGTSFCRVAVLQHPHEHPEILESDFELSTPSYVSYVDVLNQENSQNTGFQIFTGETAKQLAFVNPENTVYDIKRLIGRGFNEQEARTYKDLWPFQLVSMTGQVGIQIGDEQKLPQVIASELLCHLKKTSEEFLRSPIDCAVVTIPGYYTEIQKRLTQWACHAAGFKNMHFIAESVAAAVAYGIKSSQQSHKAKTCLIYDLGGGTFDVTVFRLHANNGVEVKATGSGDRLGGEDFNDLMTEFCITEFKRIHGVSLAAEKASEDAEVRKKSAKTLRRICNECERQKYYLSSAKNTSVVVSLDCIYEDINLHVTVTRLKFEELIFPLLNRSMRILDETLNKSGCEKDEIDDVILIGGSSRIPKVQQMVQEYFAGKQICRTIDADEAVACGAAVHAYNVFKENGAPFSVVTLLDKTQLRPQNSESASFLQRYTAALLPETMHWGNNIDGFSPRSEHAVVAVGNFIYSFGGNGSWGHPSYRQNVLDVFVLNVNEVEQGWKKLPVKNSKVIPTQRFGHSAVAHKEFVLIFGGLDTKKHEYSNSTYRFNTLTLQWDKPKIIRDKWGSYKHMPGARSHHSAVMVRNKMFIYGGRGDGMTNDLHSLHLESFCWSTIEAKGIPPSLRSNHSAKVHDDKFILIFGGYDWREKKRVNTIASFDLQSKTGTAVETRGTPPSSRMGHCAFVHSGRMYIFGGIDRKYLNDVFSYDAETFEWREVTPNGEAPSPRWSAGCVAINDHVFIFGGNDGKYCDDTHVLEM